MVKTFETSYVQQREWLLYALREDRYPFNSQRVFEIPRFDKAYFDHFRLALLQRYELLRTTYRCISGELTQVIHDVNDLPILHSYYDLTLLPEDEKLSLINTDKAKDRAFAFDFEHGPMFSINVYKKSETAYVLLITGHHLVFDDYSFNILDRFGLSHYKQYFEQSELPLAGKIRQYTEFVSLENKIITTSEGNAYRHYWENAFSRGVPAISMISQHHIEENKIFVEQKKTEVMTKAKALSFCKNNLLPGVIRRYRGKPARLFSYHFDGRFAAALDRFAKKKNLGQLSIITGAILKAFFQLSGQTFFVIDTPACARPHQKFNDTVGWLSVSGPCFFEISELNADSGLLEYVNFQLYDLLSNSIYPHELIGAEFPELIGSHMPMFLNLSYNDSLLLNNSASGMVAYDASGYCTYQDIAFFFNVYNDGITLELVYAEQLFQADQVEIILKTFVKNLTGLIFL